jgi:hypothetical protein
MKRFTKVGLIALAVAGILALSIGGVSLAAGPNGTTTTPDSAYNNYCGMNWGSSDQTSVCLTAVTELLGLTPQEIQAERLTGKSIVQIAAEKGINEDTLVNTILTAQRGALQARVTAGTLTQEQATLMIQQMEQNIRRMIEQTTFGCAGLGSGNGQSLGGGGCGMGGRGTASSFGQSSLGMGPGMMNRWASN